MNNIIEFSKVSKSFGSELLLDNISFHILPYTLTTIVGPNGAGKSTIAKLALGIEIPDSGEIMRKSTNFRIRYVPQNFSFNTNLPITPKNLIRLLAPGKDILQHSKLTDFASFDQIKNISISNLSRGQFQKLILAASFLDEPDLIILDEPIQSLDVTSQQDFYALVDNIRKIRDITILMISHDLHTVMKNSDQVICINQHICCSGRPGDLSQDKNFVKAMSGIGLYIHNHDHRH